MVFVCDSKCVSLSKQKKRNTRWLIFYFILFFCCNWNTPNLYARIQCFSERERNRIVCALSLICFRHPVPRWFFFFFFFSLFYYFSSESRARSHICSTRYITIRLHVCIAQYYSTWNTVNYRCNSPSSDFSLKFRGRLSRVRVACLYIYFFFNTKAKRWEWKFIISRKFHLFLATGQMDHQMIFVTHCVILDDSLVW